MYSKNASEKASMSACVCVNPPSVCVCDKTVITAGLSSGLGRRMGKRKQSSAREEASW